MPEPGTAHLPVPRRSPRVMLPPHCYQFEGKASRYSSKAAAVPQT